MMTMILPLLLLAGPQDAGKAADKLPEPVVVDDSMIFFGPTRSLRAVTAQGQALPATPVTVRFQCMVDSFLGDPVTCIPLEGGEKPVTSRAEFTRRAAAWSGGKGASPVVLVAWTRIAMMRIRSTTDAPKDPAKPNLVPMILSETVSAADAPTLGQPLGTMNASDMEMDERPTGPLLAAYYPAEAMRQNISVRMVATCRVMPDRMLICRNARPSADEEAPSMSPALARQFELSTYQVLGSIRLAPLSKQGDPVVGRELDVRIGFVVPQ